MKKDQTLAHFDDLMTAQANPHALTPKALEDAQRQLASYAAARLVKKTLLASEKQIVKMTVVPRNV